MLTVNEYFNGTVKSISFSTNTGAASVGVMTAGEYTFNTAGAEEMHIISGSAAVKLNDSSDWHTVAAGEHFSVAANSSFLIKLSGDTAYLCLYC